MRSYQQICSLARALDVVGDRWSMLIVRNLLLGPQRWSELRDGLPGVATNLLAQRLAQLERDGVIVQGEAGYALTAKGAGLERALFALADWGEQHQMGPPAAGDALRLRYLMTSMRRRLRPTPATAQIRLWVGERALDTPGEAAASARGFDIRLGPTPTVAQVADDEEPIAAPAAAEGCATGATASVRCAAPALLGLLIGGAPWRSLRAAGALQVDGDEHALDTWHAAWPPMQAPASAWRRDP